MTADAFFSFFVGILTIVVAMKDLENTKVATSRSKLFQNLDYKSSHFIFISA